MNDRDCRDALQSLIESETSVAQRLADALAVEADALRSVDPHELDRATLAKQRCVEELGALDSERRSLCQACSAATDEVEPLLARIDHDGALSTRWHGLLALLESCRAANQRNGAIVTLQRRRVTETLGLLRGGQDRGATYDASGEIGDANHAHLRASI